MKTALTILALSFLAAGCSTIAGPAPTEAIHAAKIEELKTWGREDWTNFGSLQEADERLLGMINKLQETARNKELLRQLGGDVAGAATVGGAIAAATNHLKAAKIGAGLAGLVSVGDQRYQLSIQRNNMLNAAKAYQCVRESVKNLDEEDLRREFHPANGDPTEKEWKELDRLNATRIEALQMVSSSAFAIRMALEDAQASIEIRQPNVDQIRESMEGPAEDEGTLPKREPLAVLDVAGLVGSPESAVLRAIDVSKVDSSNMLSVRAKLLKLQEANAAEQAALTRVIKQQEVSQDAGKKALANALEAQKSELVARGNAMNAMLGRVRDFIRSATEASSASDARLRYVRARINGLPNRLSVCRAIMAAG